ncbi:MAG: hypothetical protein AAF593_12580, partial [Planctomycetota bacterium]
RSRHQRIVWDEPRGEVRTVNRQPETAWLSAPLPPGLSPLPVSTPDLFRLDVWDQSGWGLVSDHQDSELEKLLPNVDSPLTRRLIAEDHLRKCLARANQFHASLDSPQRRPEGLSLVLYAGDGVPTNDVATVNKDGKITSLTRSSGDGTVTRESAVMDERLGTEWEPQLVTPIDWSDVNFLFTDHLGLTADPVFADNVLYLLLESPKRD